MNHHLQLRAHEVLGEGWGDVFGVSRIIGKLGISCIFSFLSHHSSFCAISKHSSVGGFRFKSIFSTTGVDGIPGTLSHHCVYCMVCCVVVVVVVVVVVIMMIDWCCTAHSQKS